MKLCPFCAEEIQDQAVVCRYCRSRLDGKRETVKTRQADWISTTAKWGVGIGFAVFIFGVLLPACGIY